MDADSLSNMIPGLKLWIYGFEHLASASEDALIPNQRMWFQVPVLAYQFQPPAYRHWKAVVMVQVIRFLLPMWETWVEFTAPSFHYVPTADIWGGSQQIRVFYLFLCLCFPNR